MPRVAVHQSNGTVFAYKVGNVIDGHHNVDLLTGAVTPVEQIVSGLVSQAKKEFPQDAVVVEDLVDGSWVPQDSSKSSTPSPAPAAPKASDLLGQLKLREDAVKEQTKEQPETSKSPEVKPEEAKPEEAKVEEPVKDAPAEPTEAPAEDTPAPPAPTTGTAPVAAPAEPAPSPTPETGTAS